MTNRTAAPWLHPHPTYGSSLADAPYCWSTQTLQALTHALDTPNDLEAARILRELRERGCPEQYVRGLRVTRQPRRVA